jgi:hypothetical protein
MAAIMASKENNGENWLKWRINKVSLAAKLAKRGELGSAWRNVVSALSVNVGGVKYG